MHLQRRDSWAEMHVMLHVAPCFPEGYEKSAHLTLESMSEITHMHAINN